MSYSKSRVYKKCHRFSAFVYLEQENKTELSYPAGKLSGGIMKDGNWAELVSKISLQKTKAGGGDGCYPSIRQKLKKRSQHSPKMSFSGKVYTRHVVV